MRFVHEITRGLHEALIESAGKGAQLAAHRGELRSIRLELPAQLGNLLATVAKGEHEVHGHAPSMRKLRAYPGISLGIGVSVTSKFHLTTQATAPLRSNF